MNKKGGFTLVELVVTLSLLVICFCFVVGFNQDFLEKNKIDSLVSQVKNSIYYSRNRALFSGQDVTLNAMDASDDWSGGMLLCVDNPRHHCQENIIYQWQWKQYPQLKLVWRGFKSTKYLTFSKTLRHSTVNGHFVILKNGIEVRRIVVNRLGRVKS